MGEERLQRHLAAILAADVVGYSRLMSRDEAGTLATLKTLRSEIFDPKTEQYGGRIFKNTGDGAFVEFPSAVDAVQAAIDVQRAVAARNADVPEDRKVELRIGISVGDVIVDGDDLYGNGVNVAARMETLAGPGGICVSGNVHEQIRATGQFDFDDLGEQAVKNIDRPVHAFRVGIGEEQSRSAPAETVDRPALSDKPSVAVLPFANMSGDPDQEYFADGMVEEIITALSRFRSFFVIARNSSFTYKGRAVDIRQVGRELGVRYVLEGSVRKGGDRLRITAQLIEAATGNHLWAEKFDGVLADVFDLQDKITEGVAGAIEPSIRTAEIERSRRKRPESLDAYDLYLRALPLTWSFAGEDARKAVELLDQALAIDPDFTAARGLVARASLNWEAWMASDKALHQKAVRHARALLATGTDDAVAIAMSGFALALMEGDVDAARNAFEQAFALNPNAAQAYGYSAAVSSIVGRLDVAIEHAERALLLNPFDPERAIPLCALARSKFLRGDYDGAVEAAQRSVQANPHFAPSYSWLSGSLARLGRVDDAREALRRIRGLVPGFDPVSWRGTAIGPVAHRDELASALREAGLLG